MSLNSSYLDAFYACAQQGHFTKAAEKLHITQSALSQRIKNLEQDLGTTLFLRERSGIRLTEQGQNLLRYCQSKELLEQETLSSIQPQADKQNSLAGVIRIGGFSTVTESVLLPALAGLLQLNPSLQLHLVSKELYELKHLLKSGQIDFMVIDEELEQEELASHVLGMEQNILVQRRNYKGPEVYLDHDAEDVMTIRYLRKKSAVGLRRHYLDDIHGIIEGVRCGLGRAVVPQHLISRMTQLEVLDPARILAVPVVLHYYKQSFYSALQNRVVQTLLRECGLILAGGK